jgi:acyl-CoA synthetase (AMP-forming)/AMP-acid ligase II
LRYVTCAGGALTPAVAHEVRSAVPDAALFLMYGQTEATARLSTLLPSELNTKLGSIGRGIEGVTLEVRSADGERLPPGEVGEIVARGENIMAGYWNDPAGTSIVLRSEGLRTGDLAHVDQDGYFWIVGRKNDMIKYGAYRINPAEIEEVVQAVPGVAEAAVIGMPDALWGEIPVAFVVVTDEQPAETSAIIEHCRRLLPRYKQLREVRFVDALPKTASGKVKRAALRELADASSHRPG